MIDMCIFADLSHDADATDAIRLLCQDTHTSSVNHVDMTPLQLRPIVLDIETKRAAGNLNTAQLQMGVWLAAKWAFLRSAIVSSLQMKDRVARQNEGRKADDDDDDNDDSDGRSELSATEMMRRNRELEGQADEALSRLCFIPGIIVHGHRWLFVLSTRSNSKTILWTGLQFGSTMSMLEAYQIVAGLRQLAAWARDVYLPWFREHVLGGYISALYEDDEMSNDETQTDD